MSPPPTITGTFEASPWSGREKRLTDLVNSLREVSRLGEGRLPLKLETMGLPLRPPAREAPP